MNEAAERCSSYSYQHAMDFCRERELREQLHKICFTGDANEEFDDMQDRYWKLKRKRQDTTNGTEEARQLDEELYDLRREFDELNTFIAERFAKKKVELECPPTPIDQRAEDAKQRIYYDLRTKTIEKGLAQLEIDKERDAAIQRELQEVSRREARGELTKERAAALRTKITERLGGDDDSILL